MSSTIYGCYYTSANRIKKEQEAKKARKPVFYLPPEVWALIAGDLNILQSVQLSRVMYGSPAIPGISRIIAETINQKIVKAFQELQITSLDFNLIYSGTRIESNKFNVLLSTSQHTDAVRSDHCNDQLLSVCDSMPNILVILSVKGINLPSSSPLADITTVYLFSTDCYGYFLSMLTRCSVASVSLDSKGHVVFRSSGDEILKARNPRQLEFGYNVTNFATLFKPIVIEGKSFSIETIDIFSGNI